MPSQEPEVLAVSPMSQGPYIEVDGTTPSKTNVIFDYLEDIQPCLTARSPFTATTSANSTIRTTVTRTIRGGVPGYAFWIIFWNGPSRPGLRL